MSRTPELELVMTLQVELAPPLEIGDIGTGIRRVIPITGGTFEGARFGRPMASLTVKTVKKRLRLLPPVLVVRRWWWRHFWPSWKHLGRD